MKVNSKVISMEIRKGNNQYKHVYGFMTSQWSTHRRAKRLSQQEKEQIEVSISESKGEGDRVRTTTKKNFLRRDHMFGSHWYLFLPAIDFTS